MPVSVCHTLHIVRMLRCTGSHEIMDASETAEHTSATCNSCQFESVRSVASIANTAAWSSNDICMLHKSKAIERVQLMSGRPRDSFWWMSCFKLGQGARACGVRGPVFVQIAPVFQPTFSTPCLGVHILQRPSEALVNCQALLKNW